jgi:hypothetical protein
MSAPTAYYASTYVNLLFDYLQDQGLDAVHVLGNPALIARKCDSTRSITGGVCLSVPPRFAMIRSSDCTLASALRLRISACLDTHLGLALTSGLSCNAGNSTTVWLQTLRRRS